MLIYISVFFLLVIIALGYTRVAKVFNILDIPNNRSSHSKPVIRGGGILFYFSSLLFFLFSEFESPGFILGLSILAVLSFTDDIVSLPARLRLPFQFLAIYFILQASGMLYLPVWALIAVSIVAVGFINIYNFMDGINGITGLYSLAVLHGFWIVSSLLPEIMNTDLLIYSGLALIIFGYFNFRSRARFFAGDVGSVSMAAIIFFIGVNFINYTGSPLIIALVLVYGIDAGYTIVRRLLSKENIFKPHRRHLYQNIVDNKGISHLKIASGYAGLQLLINHVVYLAFDLSFATQIWIFLGLFVGVSVLYFIMLKWAQADKQSVQVSTN